MGQLGFEAEDRSDVEACLETPSILGGSQNYCTDFSLFSHENFASFAILNSYKKSFLPNTPRVVSYSEASVSPTSAPSCGEVS